MVEVFLVATQWTWLISSLIGIGFGLKVAKEAYKDYQAASEHNGVKLLIACTNLRAQSMRLSKMTASGIAALLAVAEWPNSSETRRLIIIVFITYMVVATATDAVLDHFARRRVISELERGRI